MEKAHGGPVNEYDRPAVRFFANYNLSPQLVIAPEKRLIYTPVILLDKVMAANQRPAPAEPASIQEPTVS